MIEPQAVVQQSVTTFPVLSQIDNADVIMRRRRSAHVLLAMRVGNVLQPHLHAILVLHELQDALVQRLGLRAAPVALPVVADQVKGDPALWVFLKNLLGLLDLQGIELAPHPYRNKQLSFSCPVFIRL